jgi:hypothetical protein
MSNQITTAFVKEFEQGIEMLVQQRGSRLRRAVRVETGIRGKSAFFDQIGATEAQEVTTRHGDSPLIETPHARRMLTMTNIEWGDLIDDFDRVMILNDPSSEYVQNASWAVGRKIDDKIIAAFFATAKTGEEGTVDVAFPSPGNVIAADFDGDATAEGLTVAKLREARRRLLAAEALMEGETAFVGVTAKQLDDLLGTTEVTSSDFNTVRALVNGEVNTFLGFEFIRTERLLVTADPFRRLPVWVRNGMLLGVGIEPRSRITERSDKRFSWYAYYSARFGATRMQEEKVLEIQCAE